MSTASASELQEALRLGLSVVSELWSYKAKNWVTSIAAADIDNDGDIEIISGSRDGRVRALTAQGDLRWERIIGTKAWVGTVVAISALASRNQVRVLAGTRDGRVYALDKNGKTISKDGKSYAFFKEGASIGAAIDREKDHASLWHRSEQVIRQIALDNANHPGQIVIASEDRSICALDYRSGIQLWSFSTGGRVRAIACRDINNDGAVEIIAGSADKHLYILDTKGNCLASRDLGYQVYSIFAVDIDRDGQVEILLGTDMKTLVALTPDFVEKWHRTFENRLLSLYVIDLNNDGQREILAGSEDRHLYVLDRLGRTLWRHHLGHRIFSVYAGDVNNDGLVEVLLGADDQRLHALQIHLIYDLDKKIRRSYDALLRAGHTPPTSFSPAENALLEDILLEDPRSRHQPDARHIMQQAQITLDEAQFKHALRHLLKLTQQKVDLLWPRDKIRYVRALQLGDIMGDKKREVIVGTANGTMFAFSHAGKQLWSLALGERILDIQAGYLDRGKWEELAVCSTDHHIYIIDGVKGSVRRKTYIHDWMSSFSVSASGSSLAEIIVGSEDKKISLYEDTLDAPVKTISTPQGISIVCSREVRMAEQEESTPEIVAGGIGGEVYCYTRAGNLLWHYKAWDSVLDLTLQDIDGDGEAEIIIGSEDRNVHVLDSRGHLKWRYYAPHRILTVEASDINHDGKYEVLAGSGDGVLYVLSYEGDLLWKYRLNDRVRVVRAEDIDDDGHVEIAIATEDQLELVRVVDQQLVGRLVDRCWEALLLNQSAPALIEELLNDPDHLVRANALLKYGKQCIQGPEDIVCLESYTKDSSIEVRKALIQATLCCYHLGPTHVQKILYQLAMDQEQEVRLALVESLDELAAYDWSVGFDYLDRFSHNFDRFVRRAVIRKLTGLIDAPRSGISDDKAREQIFRLLLTAATDEESDWIRQEAARTLAHFLDVYQNSLIPSLYDCIVSGMKVAILEQIGHSASSSTTRHVLEALTSLMRDDLNENNVFVRVERAVTALEEVKFLDFGKDALLLYDELRHLLALQTLEDIAAYKCYLRPDQFSSGNQHFLIVLPIVDRLDSITRMLTIYAKRSRAKDRMACLLDTLNAIDEVRRFVDREYASAPGDEPARHLPDHRIFHLLLNQWYAVVSACLNIIRGKAELKVELGTKHTISEAQIGVWLSVSNQGYSNANNVKVSLLHSNDYNVIGSGSFESEVLPAQETTAAEFTIRPTFKVTQMKLSFEIAYEDASDGTLSVVKTQLAELDLELEMAQPEFRHIPNPYSTGTPSHDNRMFYGRESETTFLQDNLARPLVKTMIVLYGQRRSGKTSLLLHLAETPILEPHIAVFIDMQSASYNLSVAKLLHRIAHQLYRDLRKRGIELAKPSQDDFERNPTFALDMYLDEIEEQLHDRKLILMLDEFEVLDTQVQKGTLEPEIFEYLRSLMQHRKHLNFLLAGTHKIEQLSANYWSVFFNIARHYPLSRLSPQGASDLIQVPVQGYLQYGPDAVSKIRQMTGDQPYLIHMICRSLVDLCNEKHKSYVAINDINIVQREVMQTGQVHFSWLWEHLAWDERIALAVLAHTSKDESRSLPLAEIEEVYRHYHLKARSEDVLKSLKKLIEMDIVACELDDRQDYVSRDARYKIMVGLIRRWLHKEKPIEQVMRHVSENA